MTITDSSLLMQARWGWANSTASNRYSTEVETYRHRQPLLVPDSDPDSIDNGFAVVVTRNKVRGTGRVLQLTFRSSPGKDFELLGWAVWFEKQARF